MVEHSELVGGRERNDDPAHRRLGNPLPVNVFDGTTQPGGPRGEVGRMAGVVVHLTRRAIDGDTDVSGFRSHLFTMPDGANAPIDAIDAAGRS